MEKKLIEKLSVITEEEKRIIEGGKIDMNIYSPSGDFSVNDARLSKGAPFIIERPHTRFAPFPKHKHNFVEMVTVISGELVHVIDGEKIRMRAGDILIMNKHICHSVDKATESDLGINVIMSDSFFDTVSSELDATIFDSFAKENSKKAGTGIFLHFSTSGEKQIENLIENLLFELTEYTADALILTRTVAILFKYLSLKSKKLLVNATSWHTVEQRRKIEILDYIRTFYRTATLSELSKIMGLTLPYLSKLVCKYFGRSFKELLIEERMNRAKELIISGKMTVGAVVSDVGYENESYFHREFKRRYNTSPMNMRREAALEKAIKGD